MTRERTCAQCAYYEPVAVNNGQCRRRAPLIVEAGSGPDTIVFNGIWPAVDPLSWCGEFYKRVIRSVRPIDAWERALNGHGQDDES